MNGPAGPAHDGVAARRLFELRSVPTRDLADQAGAVAAACHAMALRFHRGGKLLLSYAGRRIRHGAEVPAGRSPFLAAIDPGLLGRVAPRRARKTADRQLRLL